MNRFAPVLRQLDAQLPMSQQARARVLLEVAADLDDAYALGLERGLSEAEAERAALESFQPSADTVAQLVHVHGGFLARLLDAAAGRARNLWEGILLSAIALAALAFTARRLADLRIFLAGGRWVWLLAGLCAVSLVIAAGKVYRLAILPDHRPRSLRHGLTLIAGLAFIQAATGLGLAAVDTFSWLTVMLTTWPGDVSSPESHLLGSSALATIALAGAIVSALAWFLLSRRVVRIEEQDVQLLFQLERGA